MFFHNYVLLEKFFGYKGEELKRIAWLITGLLIIVLTLFLVREPILEVMGSFLVVQDELKKVDVIVVLGGGDNERVEEAARLYKKGFSRHIIMFRRISGPANKPG